MRRAVRRIALLLAAVFVVAGLSAGTSTAAQDVQTEAKANTVAELAQFKANAAATYWYMNCSHYAYRSNTFGDYAPGGYLSNPDQLANHSGNVQLFEVYYRNGTEPWQPYYLWQGGIWLQPGQGYFFQYGPHGGEWKDYRNWFVQISDGHRCFPYAR